MEDCIRFCRLIKMPIRNKNFLVEFLDIHDIKKRNSTHLYLCAVTVFGAFKVLFEIVFTEMGLTGTPITI